MPRKRKKGTGPGRLGWAALALFLLVTALVSLWVLRPLREGGPAYQRPTVHIPPLRPKRLSGPPRQRPLAAIIIDDMGQRPSRERPFFTLGLPLTFSFLPFAPHTRGLAREAHERGFEVMVHLPLEPLKGPLTRGTITLSMDESEVRRRVREAVRAVPHAVGVNHHEGSRFTADYRHTRWLLEEVKALGLFYVDSRTTPRTVVPRVAREIGLPWAERRVFLDHRREEEAIRRAIRRLVRRAREIGPTVAIGHPHPETLAALRAERKALRTSLELVPASVFIERTWRER